MSNCSKEVNNPICLTRVHMGWAYGMVKKKFYILCKYYTFIYTSLIYYIYLYTYHEMHFITSHNWIANANNLPKKKFFHFIHTLNAMLHRLALFLAPLTGINKFQQVGFNKIAFVTSHNPISKIMNCKNKFFYLFYTLNTMLHQL